MAQSFNINDLKSQLVGGGARQTLFQVTFNNPATGPGAPDAAIAPFMVKATSLPEMSIGNYQIPYFGRKVNLAGDRQFQPWQVTVINDENFLVRDGLENWSNQINSLQSNIRQFSSSSPLLYKASATVTQFDRVGNAIREYTFSGIYPQDISAIGLDWNATDQIEEFNCTFQYDYYAVSGQTSTLATQ